MMSRLKKSGKRSGTTASVTDHDEEASSCIICLERVSCRGKLSVCNHWFCFPCILEWAENTNTCPICKARFRCITKIHVSPFKSPPTKVRVGDKDQRVWNDDDDLVAEDVLDAIDSDDLDDDYEPPYHMENPWTRSSRNRERQQESNVRDLTGTSRQPELDQYDLEDSFIDDTDEALQAYLYSAYSRDDDFDGHDSNLDCEKIDTDDDDGSDAEDSDVEILPSRVSPYALRNKQIIHRRSSRSTINSFVSLSQVTGEQACLSPASTDSFIVSDESADELNTDWVPFGNHDKNSRTKKKKDCVTNRKQGSKERQASPKSQSRCVKSKRLKKQQEPVQGRMCKTRSQQTLSSDDEFQDPSSSSRDKKTGNQSLNGWISMVEKRTRVKSSPSTRTSTFCKSTKRKRAPVTLGKELQQKDSEVNFSGSDSDAQVLRDITNHQEPQLTSKAHCSSIHTPHEAPFKHSSRLKHNRHFLSSTSKSTNFGTHDDLHVPGESSEEENNLSDAVIIQPTPCSKTTRSIFTKRRHKSPASAFGDNHLEATKDNSRAQALAKRIDYSKSCQVKISPLFKTRDHRRKRCLMTLSSDSD